MSTPTHPRIAELDELIAAEREAIARTSGGSGSIPQEMHDLTKLEEERANLMLKLQASDDR
ncbi:hypothetical protein N9H93_00375 [Rhizobiaceae bacterium]|nr:hypothetical protein [Rhizobiaceae bacterium]